MKSIMGIFNQLQKAYHQYCYRAVAEDGIKMSEMVCILFLYNGAPKDTARHIAEYSRLSPGMVSKSLESLRAAGYVEGKRDQDDGRYVHLRLTPQATPIVEKLSRAQTEFITRIARGISKEEFDQMCAVAEAMGHNLEQDAQLLQTL